VQWLAPTIPATWEVEIRKILVGNQPQEKASKTLSQPIKAWYGSGHLSSQMCERHKSEDHGKAWPGQKFGDPIQKITKAKRVMGVAQVVECLPSKCKALNLNPSTSHSPLPLKKK
jgi:hypothetical protein